MINFVQTLRVIILRCDDLGIRNLDHHAQPHTLPTPGLLSIFSAHHKPRLGNIAKRWHDAWWSSTIVFVLEQVKIDDFLPRSTYPLFLVHCSPSLRAFARRYGIFITFIVGIMMEVTYITFPFIIYTCI